jgi:GTPase SAR1 family protein
MGNCGSEEVFEDDESQSVGIELKHRSTEINRSLVNDQKVAQSQVKLLLLGAGECGKSTILKQMKILHKNGFTDDDRRECAVIIYANILQAVQALCQAVKDLDLKFSSQANSVLADQVLSLRQLTPGTHVIQAFQQLWSDSGVQRAFSRQNEFNFLDSAPYFLNSLQRVLQPNFIPNDQDILRARKPTVGVIEIDFWIEGTQFRMFDVGGQRGERKKWIHIFEDVRAILFIASLNEYDQVLLEDRTRNRLVESVSLFEGIIGLPWFRNTSIILFLNKNDLFQDKIRKVDLGAYFQTYTGGLNYEEGLLFIKDLFFSRNRDPNKSIYAHVTCACDTKQIEFVWKATRHIVMKQNLSTAGLM